MRGAHTKGTERARLLRRSDNEAEAVMWSELRGRRLNGYKFVRQFPIGRYFADFACRDHHLVVEIDGSQHANRSGDSIRDMYMVANGWSVVRFWNTQVLKECGAVLETIVAILEKRLTDEVRASDLTFIPAGGRHD